VSSVIVFASSFSGDGGDPLSYLLSLPSTHRYFSFLQQFASVSVMVQIAVGIINKFLSIL